MLAVWPLAAGPSSSARRPQQAPTFRSEVNVVRLDVSVLNENRTPVRGLDKEEFAVFIDGVLQRLVDVTEVHYVPGDGSRATLPASLDFVSNQAPPTRRAFVLILDDALTPGDPFALRYTRQAARAFVEGLHPDDLVAVVFPWNGTHSQDFTADRDRTLAAIERFQPGPDNFDWARSLGATGLLKVPALLALMRTLRDAARLLNGVPHLRGAMVLISPGIPSNTVEDPLGLRTLTEVDHAYLTELTSATGEMRYARIPIYALSNRGLVAPGSGPNPWRGVREARLANDFLKTVADSAGGFAVVDTNDPVRGVEQVLLENSHHYVIGYEATYPLHDGRYRRLEIRVSRPGVTVFPSGRSLRTPSRAEHEPVLSPRLAMSGILPVAGVPLALRTKAASGELGRANVAIDLVIGPIDDAAESAEVECAVFHAGTLKEITAVARNVSLGGTSATVARLALTVPPGRYNLRCGAYVPAIRHVGSVYAPLDVPSRSKLFTGGPRFVAMARAEHAQRDVRLSVN